MNIRKQLREEMIACAKDQSRDRSELRGLIDDHAAMADFDPWFDGAIENDAIALLHSEASSP